MKKIAMTILLFTSAMSFSFSQIKTDVTTEEEYNFMTKGYQIQISSGLDMKKGYAVGETKTITESTYNFSFIPLYKIVNKENVIVGYIVKAISTSWNNTYWFGMSIGNKDLLNKAFTSIGNLDEPMTTTLSCKVCKQKNQLIAH